MQSSISSSLFGPLEQPVSIQKTDPKKGGVHTSSRREIVSSGHRDTPRPQDTIGSPVLVVSLSLYRNANVLILCIFQLYRTFQSALSAVCSIWNLARCIPLLSYLEGDSLKHFNTEAEINPTVFENVSSIACSVHPMCILDNQTIQHECFKVLRRNHFQRCRPEA